MTRDVSIMSWTLPLVLCAAFSSFGDGERIIPPDHSLSVREYVAAGLPDPTVEWAPRDRESARDAMWALWEQDPTLLPRAGSPRSNLVFRKLLDEEFHSDSLDMFGDTPVGKLREMGNEELEGIIRGRSFLAVYVPRSETDLLFDREIIEIEAERLYAAIENLRDLIELNQRSLELREERRKSGEPVPDIPELEVKPSEILLPLIAQLALLSSSDQFSLKSRAVGLDHLARGVANSVDLLAPEEQRRAREVLAEVRDAEKKSSGSDLDTSGVPATSYGNSTVNSGND